MGRPIAITSSLIVVLAACSTSETVPDEVIPDSPIPLTLFFTTDEHGFLEPQESGDETVGGAANLMGLLRERGHQPNGERTLLLSSGDNWSGPAISTWFGGEPSYQVMNAMGYAASALGNHEFDGDPSVTTAWANFPYLAANLKLQATGEPPEFVSPLSVVERQGVQIGIVGLITRETATVSVGPLVESLDFEGYRSALEDGAAAARGAGAEVLVAVAHVCPGEVLALTRAAADLGYTVLAAGHCHEQGIWDSDGVAVVSAGAFFDAFAQVDLVIHPSTHSVIDYQTELVDNRFVTASGNPVTPDPTVAALVAEWKEAENQALGDVVGYTATGIAAGWGWYNLVTDAWVAGVAGGQVSLSKQSSLRYPIPAGEITLGDIVSALPYENSLVAVTLTGSQLRQNLLCCGPLAVGGATVLGGSVNLADGTPIDLATDYKLIVADYVYLGGGDFPLSTNNGGAELPGIHWRQPLIDWLADHPTDADHPLEDLLDETIRIQ